MFKEPEHYGGRRELSRRDSWEFAEMALWLVLIVVGMVLYGAGQEWLFYSATTFGGLRIYLITKRYRQL